MLWKGKQVSTLQARRTARGRSENLGGGDIEERPLRNQAQWLNFLAAHAAFFAAKPRETPAKHPSFHENGPCRPLNGVTIFDTQIPGQAVITKGLSTSFGGLLTN